MSMDMDGDRTSKEYWDARAVEPTISDRQRIWFGSEFDKQEAWIWDMISRWKDCTVLDLGCGAGRYAKHFLKDKYLGVDFSDGMIELAKKNNPGYEFEVGDSANYVPKKKFEVIFMNMLTDRMDPEELYKRLRDYCSGVIIRGYVDRVVIVSAKEFT